MVENRIPESLLRKASITPGGEHAWRMQDVKDVVAAARDAGLACLGGQVQFQFDGGTCEAYWINYDPEERSGGETWAEFVTRSAEEVAAAFDRVCREVDFSKLACQFDFGRKKVERDGCDPAEYLWFPLYFAPEDES